jgi:hypothetical protein
MSLEEEFNKERTEWEKHIYRVSYSSNPRVYIDCEAYRKLVSLGDKIFPLIREDLQKPWNVEKIGFFWLHVLYDIAGEKFSQDIPESIRGKNKELKEYALKWLDEYLPK